MIENNTQLDISAYWLAKFKEARHEQEKFQREAKWQLRLNEAIIAGIDSKIADLEKEIEDYERRRS